MSILSKKTPNLYSRYTIALLAATAVLFPVLRIADLIDEDDALIWSCIFIVWIVLNLALIKVYKSNVSARIAIKFNAIILIIIFILVFSISGFESQPRYKVWHEKNNEIRREIESVFFSQYPDHLYTFRETEYGTEIDLNIEGSPFYLNTINRHLEQLISEKITKYPTANLVIADGISEKIYQKSGLSPGDKVDVDFVWRKALIYKRKNFDIYHFSDFRSECLLRVPLDIKNKNMYVDFFAVPEFTKEVFGTYPDHFYPKDRKKYSKILLLPAELQFTNGPYNSVVDRMRYDGYGYLILDYADLKDFKYENIQSSYYRSLMTHSCDNLRGAQDVYMSLLKDPYLNKMLYPYITSQAKNWEMRNETVFMRIDTMLDSFSFKFIRLFD